VSAIGRKADIRSTIAEGGSENNYFASNVLDCAHFGVNEVTPLAYAITLFSSQLFTKPETRLIRSGSLSSGTCP
jgi:hypothetical protein